MRLFKALLAIFAAVGRMWRARRTARKRELIVSKLLATSEGRQKLAMAMVEPQRCGGLEHNDADDKNPA